MRNIAKGDSPPNVVSSNGKLTLEHWQKRFE